MTEKDFTFEIYACVLFPLFLMGTFGNALTIASVIYAKLKSRHEFHEVTQWRSKTVFIINLAVVDFSYCFLVVLMCVHALALYLKEDLRESASLSCKIFVIGIQQLATIDGWCIALIAFTRAFPKIK